MNVAGPMLESATPWGRPGLASEDDLRAAQEYFFQNHATNAKLIAEGRSASGFMKTYTRRKLEKEMGEDFKLYTGQELGGGDAGQESQGIRGELNELLKTVYTRIAPNQPIVSPTQEDLTILSHPHGALEVCFAMVFYYNSLLKKSATLASNRRKVLKSVLDEELFKWVWRLTTKYVLSDAAARVDMQEYHLSAGLPYVPHDRQRTAFPQLVFEIGQFMLGKTLAESHLRFPLCYYFVTYLRALQSEVLAQPGLANPEEIYNLIMQRKPADPVNNVLVAIDLLMNMSGNSMESFDDILKDEQAVVDSYIPAAEAQFLRQHDPYADFEAFGEAVRLALPGARKEEIATGHGGTLPLRLLLVLRAVTPSVSAGILNHVPAPVLIMLRNRVVNGPQDEGAKHMADRLRTALDARVQRGEHMSLPAANRAGMSGGSTAPAGTEPTLPEAPVVSQSSGAAGSPRPAAAAAPAAAPAGSAPAAPAAPPAVASEALLDKRLLVGWRREEGQMKIYSTTLREMMGLVGPEPRLVLSWVMLALQTGQVFDFPAASVNRELVEKVVKVVVAKSAGLPAPRLGKPQVAQLINELRDAPPQKTLLALIVKGQLAQSGRRPDQAGGALETLHAKFGPELADFLGSPSKEEFRDRRVGLSAQERQTVAVLQKLARPGA